MIFLRHPSVAAPGLCYGRFDPPPGPDAEREIAAALAAAPRAGAVRASPAGRCRVLAEALAARDAAALILDERLLELDFGAWEGRRWDTIERPESDLWAEDPWRRAPPGGESFAALHARVAAVLEDAGGALIVSHAGPIRAARMILEGASMAAVFAAPVPYAAPIRIGGG